MMMVKSRHLKMFMDPGDWWIGSGQRRDQKRMYMVWMGGPVFQDQDRPPPPASLVHLGISGQIGSDPFAIHPPPCSISRPSSMDLLEFVQL